MMKRLVVLAGAAAIALAASDAGAQMTQWVPPACKLNTKHYLVNSAQLYLKNATGAKSPEQKQTSLKDAGRILYEAVTTGGQAENPAVWYMYGRYYLLVDSMVGADSAFRKAEKAQPDCADDITIQRRSAWVPSVQAAADALNKNDYATAKSSFRRANAIYQGDPIGFYYLANVFINENNVDSAIAYFKQTVQYANKQDTSQTETYETSVFNVGRLFHQKQEWDSAATWYERYRLEKPGDTQALTGLAVVYEAKGDSIRASKLYDEILMNAETVPALDLFSAGIQLFKGGKHQRAAKAFQAVLKKNPFYRDALYNLASTYLSLGNVPDSVLLSKKARDSVVATARDTSAGTAKADSILKAKKDSSSRAIGAQMLPVARSIVALDGQNRNTLRMLAVAFQYIGEQDSILLALETAEGLRYEVNVLAFQPTQGGHTIQGTFAATQTGQINSLRDSIRADSARLETVSKGVQARTTAAAVRQALQAQKPVLEKRIGETRAALQNLAKVAVPPITFDFIDAQGQVIASQTATGTNLEFYAVDVCLAANGDKQEPSVYCRAIEAMLQGRVSPEQSAMLTPQDRERYSQARSSKEFSLTANGEGIQGWRYKIVN